VRGRLVRGGSWAHENEPDPEIARRLVPTARQLWMEAMRREY